mmetsp:Transcript_6019/g.16026  ORF Transcript_6019/g.16026 Transcript_6019/m.16026 type:complete len:235 (-) Transcript_6019:336-1040(-)
MRASTSLLLMLSLSRKRAWASNSAFFCRSSALRAVNCSEANTMALSLWFMACMASSHCRINTCRSLCSFLKSSAALSSWIWAACVSTTSSSRSAFLATTARLIFSSICCSSLTLAASCFLYLSSAALSSSFCRCASAHCSISSWFQFISSLNPSSFSLALYTEACKLATLSASSARSAMSLPMSLVNRPVSLSARACRCFSVLISFVLDSTRPCVYLSSCCTFCRCSSMMPIRS